MEIIHNAEKIKIKSHLPVVPLRDVVIFPYMIYPLLIGRDFTTTALQEAMNKNKQVLLIAQKQADVDDPEVDDLYKMGVIARILQVMKMPNGTYKVLIEGLVRAQVKKITHTNGYLLSEIQIVSPKKEISDIELEALSRTVMEQFTEFVQLNRRIPEEVLVTLASVSDYQQKADNISAQIMQQLDTKQKVLEANSVKEQFLMLSDILKKEIEILKIEQKINGNIRESMTRSQKEFYLQQQLKAIKDELGQFDESSAEVEDLYARLESHNYPFYVKEKAEVEIKKLAKMHPYSAESGVVRSYLDWLLSLPWNNLTEDRTDFSQVKEILDGDHYGLEKPKNRILEHLAIIKLAGKVKGPILCLVGPPGVGKTSVGRSVARALGRKFVRMSLGGVHDEAEIRGHRRTYIGALPGRIIQSIKKAGSCNPVFLLDEVDKIGKDFRGDPASALLEVLDPEQNNSFNDNYLEVDFDLSHTLFITTANTMTNIPPALRDRMEIIRLPGYLDFEKVAIAQHYLLPKLIKELGLSKVMIKIEDTALLEIINSYTREAGVRELERKISTLLRKSAISIASGKKIHKLTITKNKVHKLLGAPKYIDTGIKTSPTIGYAVGLAWTEMGGELLPVEVVLMKGKSKLTLTGSLGNVMQESAVAALSYIRKNAVRFGLKDNFFEHIEIHIHVPEGAVPKDGPSAGITLLTALLSSLTDIPVQTDIALTGEITLIGDVLPVGGLNEKLLAAKRHGIRKIILPDKNRKDISELQPELLEGLHIYFVKTVKEALKLAMAVNPFVKMKANNHTDFSLRL
ncbi:MAG: endopeptidase La [FCB group bacterium]|nr:endopeptidase La [FCB group bacterium]